MNNKNTYRILAKDCTINNDTWLTGINNNDLIIGPSGAGKTRGYVKPNIMQCNESMIIADTKGNLISEMSPILKKAGYKIIHMNFKNLSESYGYNPLDFIRFDDQTGKYNEQDIMTVANVIVPNARSRQEPFWEDAARMYLACSIAYVMEFLPKEEHSLEFVIDLISEMDSPNFKRLFDELKATEPDCLALKLQKLFKANGRAEKMHASILGVLSEKFNGLNFEAALKMYANENKIDFKKLGIEKTAVFLTISDTDRSMDRLVSLFYTQALQELVSSADSDYPDCRLPIPVRFILDDFATNAYIPDFDNIISVIRSREIYVSIILQSITQLNALYGSEKATTIINNCDNCLYLGGQDVTTADFMSIKANRTVNTILEMPLNESYLFTRGSKPKKVQKYDIKEHERYCELPECRYNNPQNYEAQLELKVNKSRLDKEVSNYGY